MLPSDKVRATDLSGIFGEDRPGHLHYPRDSPHSSWRHKSRLPRIKFRRSRRVAKRRQLFPEATGPPQAFFTACSLRWPRSPFAKCRNVGPLRNRTRGCGHILVRFLAGCDRCCGWFRLVCLSWIVDLSVHPDSNSIRDASELLNGEDPNSIERLLQSESPDR